MIIFRMSDNEEAACSGSKCVFGEMHTDEGVHPMEVTLTRSPSSDFGDSGSHIDSQDGVSSDDSDSDSDDSDGNEGGVEDNDCDCDECAPNKAGKDRMNMYALNWRATKAPSEVS